MPGDKFNAALTAPQTAIAVLQVLVINRPKLGASDDARQTSNFLKRVKDFYCEMCLLIKTRSRGWLLNRSLEVELYKRRGIVLGITAAMCSRHFRSFNDTASGMELDVSQAPPGPYDPQESTS